VLALGLALSGGGIGLAQPTAPVAGAAGHPAHVHAGTCTAAHDPAPVFPLADVAPIVGPAVGAASALPVEQSVTELDVALDDLFETDYAIEVHTGGGDLDAAIACGDIGGAVVATGDGSRELAIGLSEQNASERMGVALLRDGRDGGTTVTIYLTTTGTEAAGATPPGGATAEEVAIDIVDFAFEPVEVTVPAGTTVTWTNVGPTDHTTVAYIDGDIVWASEIMRAGDTYSHTFDEPGTFVYRCGLHEGMLGSITVVETPASD
jgi:plastocyanin